LMGIVLGTGTGLLVLHYRQNILNGMSKLANMELLPPELYFLNELPSRTEASDVLMIVGLVLLLCLTGGSLPAWLAARRPPVEALRHD